MKRCLSIVVLALLALVHPTLAQTGMVSGSVLDRQTGDPLVGAIVFLEGTQIGITCDIEDSESGEDSLARLEAGDLVLANNIWWGFGAGEDVTSLAPEFVLAHLVANNNRLEDPLLMGISRTRDGGLDPRLQDSSPAWNGSGTIPDDGFYTQVDYVGAFGNEL